MTLPEGELRSAVPSRSNEVSPRRMALHTQTLAQAQAIALRHNATFIHLKHTSAYAQKTIGYLEFRDLRSTPQAIAETHAALVNEPGVQLVEFDRPTQITGAGTHTPASRLTPDDPLLSRLWGMRKISAQQAWDVAHDASDIIVVVIDTGLNYDHPDLQANLWTNADEIPGNKIDDDQNGYVDDIHGIDVHNKDADPIDDNGHGSHCAGTIGAVGNDGNGVPGVVWGVQMMGCKAQGSDGRGEDSVIAECMEYVMEMKTRGQNIVVTNNSWGADAHTATIQSTFKAAGAMNIIHACAAGNNSANNDSARVPTYPASYPDPSIISVLNTNSSDQMSSSSSYGPRTCDLGAPGDKILSCAAAGNRHVSKSGTSMAAPHVAGALALLASYTGSEDISTLRSLLLSNVDRVSALSNRCATGGRLNLAKAINAATPKPPEDEDDDAESTNTEQPSGSKDDEPAPSGSGEATPSDEATEDPSESKGPSQDSDDDSNDKSKSDTDEDSKSDSDDNSGSGDNENTENTQDTDKDAGAEDKQGTGCSFLPRPNAPVSLWFLLLVGMHASSGRRRLA